MSQSSQSFPAFCFPAMPLPSKKKMVTRDRRRGGDSTEERERVPLPALTGREEGRGDDLWAGAHYDGHRKNRPKSLHQAQLARPFPDSAIPY